MTAQEELKRLSGSYFVDGAYQNSASGKGHDVIDPATEEVIGEIADCSEDEVNQVIAVANRAQAAWAAQTGLARAERMHEVATKMRGMTPVLSEMLTREMGKPYKECADEVDWSASAIDYYAEIEWFDSHLGRALKQLDELGELDNTLVIVTSDNGMAFPRAKANCFEFGVHVPLAIMWPSRAKGGREVSDPVGFVDLTATILEAGGVTHPALGQAALAPVGRSLVSLLESGKSGRVEPQRTHVFSGRERHSSSRHNNMTYPQRCLRSDQYIYIRNFKPDRWPAGDPQKFDSPGKLGPMHGGYHDIDACPSMTFLIENREQPEIAKYFHWSVDKRPGEELYDITSDPDCLNNLALDPAHYKLTQTYRDQMDAYLKKTGDPRALGQGNIWESYKRYSRMRTFPKP